MQNLTDGERQSIATKISSMLSLFSAIKDPESNKVAIECDYGKFFELSKNIVLSINRNRQDGFVDLFGSDGPSELIYDSIHRSIALKVPSITTKTTSNATGLFSSAEIQGIAETIVDDIASYPRVYHVLFPLQQHEVFKQDIDKLPNVKVIIFSEGHPNQYNLSFDGPATQDTPVLVLYIPGYASNIYPEHFNPIIQDRLFSLLGLIVALGAFEVRQRRQTDNDIPQIAFQVYDASISPPAHKFNLKLPFEVSETFYRLQPTDTFSASISEAIKLLQLETATTNKSSFARQLLLASRWYFDSLTQFNQTHSYINAMIGMEIILGEEKPKDKITGKLADRFAYLMALSSINRKHYREIFDKLYDLRSKIVHTGKALLPARQASRLRDTQMFLKQLICLESGRLISDNIKPLQLSP